MDVDNSEIDLISQFRTMNTNDKDFLIAEFKRLSKTELSNEGCCFFLDLAEWNLNTALWAYYEYDAPEAFNIPQMRFLYDVTVPSANSVLPVNTRFVKTWRIKNIGPKRFPPGCTLRLVNGNDLTPGAFVDPQQQPQSPPNFSTSPTAAAASASAAVAAGFPRVIHVDSLAPDEELEVSVELQTPAQPGIYQCQYRLFTPVPSNTPFGDPLWLILSAEQHDVDDITRQLKSAQMFGQQQQQLPAGAGQHPMSIFSFPTHQAANSSSSFEQQQQQPPSNNQVTIFDNNSNLLYNNSSSNNNNRLIRDDDEATMLKQQQQQRFSSEDDKRPDFYDDMFS